MATSPPSSVASSSTPLPPSNIDVLKEGGISTMSFRIDREGPISTDSSSQSNGSMSLHPLQLQNNDSSVTPSLAIVEKPVSESNSTDHSLQQPDAIAQNISTPITANVNAEIVGMATTTPQINQTIPSVLKAPVVSQSAAAAATMTTTPASSSGPLLNLSALSQTDASLLALLQSNLPQLNQMRENLKTLIQSSILLQSLKSASAAAAMSPSSSNRLSPKTISNIAAAMATPTPSNGSPQKVAPIPAPSSGTPGSGTPKATPTVPVATSIVGGMSRKPVLAQVIGKTPQKDSGLLQGRQLLPPMQLATPQTVRQGSPISTTIPSNISSLSSRTNQKHSPSDLSFPSSVKIPQICESVSTLVKPLDQEPMDIDVGETPPSLELPPHLKDHSYCIYNPEVSPTPRPAPENLPTIPMERLSYAPEVPDSPRTLFKLLKVLPKKLNGPTSRPKTTAKYGTPTGRPLRFHLFVCLA